MNSKQNLDASKRPNGIWLVDLIEPFELRRKRCNTLIVFDVFSRKMLICQTLIRPLIGEVRAVLETAFKEFGLPEKIRTKSRAPFSTTATGALSRLEVWWIKLGIAPDRISPSEEDVYAIIAEYHSLIKSSAAKPAKPDLRRQQAAFDAFKSTYNLLLRQKVLQGRVPDSLYNPSPRKFLEKTSGIVYPEVFKVEKVYPNGVITINETQWYISGSLKDELVGVELISEGIWRVYFGSLLLGYIDSSTAYKLPGRRRSGTLTRETLAIR